MTGSANRLLALTKELRADWAQTRQYWSDAKSAEFEQRFLTHLFAAVNQTANDIETLERILKKVRDDCG
jgi:hypothetical protein